MPNCNGITSDIDKESRNISDVKLLMDELYGTFIDSVDQLASVELPYQAISYVEYKVPKKRIKLEDKNIYSRFDLVDISGKKWALAYGNTSWSNPDIPYLLDIAAVRVTTTSNSGSNIANEVYRSLCHNHNFMSSFLVACDDNTLWFNPSGAFSSRIADFFENELRKNIILLPDKNGSKSWRVEYRKELPIVLSNLFISILSERK